jgi:hypothetical protein
MPFRGPATFAGTGNTLVFSEKQIPHPPPRRTSSTRSLQVGAGGGFGMTALCFFGVVLAGAPVAARIAGINSRG